MSHVLAVVDDESSFRLRFKLVLQKVGIVTQAFHDFSDADTMIAQYVNAKKSANPFNVIFLDINLKSGRISNGLDLLKELRDKYNGDPIIVTISTSTRQEEVDRAKLYKANAYVVKTGNLAKFAERMAQFKVDFLSGSRKDFTVYGAEELI